MAEAMLDDALMREALGLRRRGAVNYTQELVHEDEPEPPKKRRAGGTAAGEGSSRSGARKPAASSARKRRTRGADSDDDDDDDDEDDEDEDFSEDEPPQRKAKGRGSKAAPRQSVRSEPRGKYKEPSDDDDDFHSDDGDERRGGAAAVAAVQSIYDKILSQRPAEKAGEEEGEVEPSDSTEYLAKPRGKCVCAAAAACRARLAVPSPARWSAPRDGSCALHPALPLPTCCCSPAPAAAGFQR